MRFTEEYSIKNQLGVDQNCKVTYLFPLSYVQLLWKAECVRHTNSNAQTVVIVPPCGNTYLKNKACIWMFRMWNEALSVENNIHLPKWVCFRTDYKRFNSRKMLTLPKGLAAFFIGLYSSSDPEPFLFLPRPLPATTTKSDNKLPPTM